jgi:hypothetical protein
MKVNLLFILPAINNVLLISKNVEKFEWWVKMKN